MRRAVGDIEGNGLLPDITNVWCGVFRDIDTGEVNKFTVDNDPGFEKMKAYLDTCSVIIGHNFIDYDVPVLDKILGYSFQKDTFVIDTYILSQITTPDRYKHPRTGARKGAHSLENFGNIFGKYKPEHEDWTQYSPEMLHRCSEDVDITYLTWKSLNKKADLLNPKSKWLVPYKIEAAFGKCLVKQKLKGMLVDEDKIDKHIAYLTEEIDKIDRDVVPRLPKTIKIKEQNKDGVLGWNKKPFKGNGDLNQRTSEWCGVVGLPVSGVIAGPFSRIEINDFDLGSVQSVKDYLLSEGWIPEEWNYKEDPVTKVKHKTSPKMSKNDNFLGVNSDVGQLVAKRMCYRHRRSQLEGFKRIIREDGRITANVTGITPTARLKHAGIVNIPGGEAVFGHEMREVFIVPKGYKLVGCDAASCQLRNLCHHMGDDEYTEAVLNGNSDDGTDIHSVNMRKTGITIRRVAKNFIYGFLFGAGDTKVGAILGTNKASDGKKMKAQFLAELPKLKNLIDHVEEQFRKFKCIQGLDGREIYPRSSHECLCYLLQSDEAIVMKVATIYAHKWIEERGLDAHMVSHMHDEYQWEVREDHAKEVAELLEQAIVKAGEWLKMNVPMAGKAAIGNNWAETH